VLGDLCGLWDGLGSLVPRNIGEVLGVAVALAVTLGVGLALMLLLALGDGLAD